jgi:hypothetical protein
LLPPIYFLSSLLTLPPRASLSPRIFPSQSPTPALLLPPSSIPVPTCPGTNPRTANPDPGAENPTFCAVVPSPLSPIRGSVWARRSSLGLVFLGGRRSCRLLVAIGCGGARSFCGGGGVGFRLGVVGKSGRRGGFSPEGPVFFFFCSFPFLSFVGGEASGSLTAR